MNHITTQRGILIGVGLASLLAFGACDPNGPGNTLRSPNSPTTGVAGIDRFSRDGGQAVTRARVGQCVRFLPPEGPARSRIGLGWANGTTATPDSYENLLVRSASHGILVTAAVSTNTGNGQQVAQCMRELAAARTDANGNFATAGHSQGGSGCINAARRINQSNAGIRVVTTCQVQPDGNFTAGLTRGTPNLGGACGLLRIPGTCEVSADDIAGSRQAPAVVMCGTSDELAPCNAALAPPGTGDGNGNVFFARARVPVVKLNVIGADHVSSAAGAPIGLGGLFSPLVAACASAANGDTDASQALQPNGGLNRSRALTEVEFRNF